MTKSITLPHAEVCSLPPAHCIYIFDDARDYSVVIGHHNLEDVHVGEKIELKEQLLHPNYEIFDGNDYNVALIYLEKPANTSVGSMTSMVTLNTNGSMPRYGQIASFASWGDSASYDAIDIGSTNLLEVETVIISIKEWEQFRDLTFSYKGWVTDNMICTFSAGKDSCQRDSGKLIQVISLFWYHFINQYLERTMESISTLDQKGSPLVIKSGTETNNDIQIGVISWDMGCAKNFSGVSTQISFVYTWIAKFVCKKSAEPPPNYNCRNSSTPKFPTQSPIFIEVLESKNQNDNMISSVSKHTVSPTVNPSVTLVPTVHSLKVDNQFVSSEVDVTGKPTAEPTINLPNSSTAVDVSHSPTTNTASDVERNASSTVP